TANLAAYLRQGQTAPLAEVAYTLQVGRASLAHRRMLVCQPDEPLADLLAAGPSTRLLTAYHPPTITRTVALLVPGVGEHYAGMAAGLYASEAVFRASLDRCCELLRSHLG